MKEAVKNNKLKLLIIYSYDKRYRELGLNIVDLTNNNNLLLENLKICK